MAGLMRILPAIAITGAAFWVGPALAQSQTEPGFTTGIPLYAPKLPEGLYLDVVPDLSLRNANPDTTFKALTPFFTLQTSLKVANARIMFVAAPVYADLKIKNGPRFNGFYNTYVGIQATWNLGGNWGLGVRAAGWIPQGGEVATHYVTLAPRIGVTNYTGKEHFTASLERGWTLKRLNQPAGSNYVNLDLTYARTKGKFEYGVISFMSTDTNRKGPIDPKQAQIAIGTLVGYNFGSFQLQAKLSTDVYQRNYGGPERRVEFNIFIPLWKPKTTPAGS